MRPPLLPDERSKRFQNLDYLENDEIVQEQADCVCELYTESDGFSSWHCCWCRRRDLGVCNFSRAKKCKNCGHHRRLFPRDTRD